ncbi:MAG: nucleoside-diphosphate kinase [Alistipes sp.]|nr:nucleoside-diphosphate kinase [Alistipes sp.]
MSNNRTFTMIKPDAVEAGNSAAILKHLVDAGFRIVALKMWCMSRNDAKRFYAVHTGKPFFDGLIEFMTSGPIIAAILEKENAVAELRKTVGATNPEEAAEGTVRKLYGSSVRQNAIHASDSDENARIEWQLHFCDKEIML